MIFCRFEWTEGGVMHDVVKDSYVGVQALEKIEALNFFKMISVNRGEPLV
jgi:hypothetical protein